MSTGIAGLLKAYTKTQFAVFMPTPGRSRSLSKSSGTFPLNLSIINCETSLILLALTL
jgi:hypothetical protein